MVAATDIDKNGGGKLLERNNANSANNATSASTEKRALYKTDDELNGFRSASKPKMEPFATETGALHRWHQEFVLLHVLRKGAMDKIETKVNVEYHVSDMMDYEENGPVLESNEEDSEYDELQLEDNDGIDFGEEVQVDRNTADDSTLLENASCLEILALVAGAGQQDTDLEMIDIEMSWPTEIRIAEIAISLIDTIIYNTIFNITIFCNTIFNITMVNNTIFSDTIFSEICPDRDKISRDHGDEIAISLD